MALENINVPHVQTWDTFDTLTQAEQATREILAETTTFDEMKKIEGFMLMNSAIVAGVAKGSVNLGISNVSLNNPAGSYRANVKPKVSAKVRTAIRGLSEVQYQPFTSDSYRLEINRAFKTPSEILNKEDEGWSTGGLRSALVGTHMNAIVTEMNYFIYPLFKDAALYTVDPIKGKSFRVTGGIGAQSDAAYTTALIKRLATYTALPTDRYVYGFNNKMDIKVILDPEASAKVLSDRIRVFDGHKSGMDGYVYTGLPYSYSLAGHPTVESSFINDPFTLTADRLSEIITTTGRFGPLLFNVAQVTGGVDIVPETASQGLSSYALSLYGAQIADVFRQYVSTGYESAAPIVWGDKNITDVTITNILVDGFTISGTATGADTQAIFRIQELGEVAGAWTVLASNEDVTGLNSKSQYKIEVAASDAAASLVPETDSGNDLIATVYAVTN